MGDKKRVLFLCTGNSARSQMAEALLRNLGEDRYIVFSAGTHPQGVHPRTLEVMGEIGVDMTGHTSKSLDQFVSQPFDFVITVCDRAQSQCPVFPGVSPIHWSFEDPAQEKGDQQLAVFRRVRGEIEARIRTFVEEMKEDDQDDDANNV